MSVGGSGVGVGVGRGVGGLVGVGLVEAIGGREAVGPGVDEAMAPVKPDLGVSRYPPTRIAPTTTSAAAKTSTGLRTRPSRRGIITGTGRRSTGSPGPVIIRTLPLQ